MEGSFAHAANHYHFKRAHWRRLWRQQIQDWIIAAVQNIARLCGAIGTGVIVTRPTRPKQGASAARRSQFASRHVVLIGQTTAFPLFSEFSMAIRAA